ncbi:MAG: hypothetical protein U0936_24210 [Planctomycetaceae bacterium]
MIRSKSASEILSVMWRSSMGNVKTELKLATEYLPAPEVFVVTGLTAETMA